MGHHVRSGERSLSPVPRLDFGWLNESCRSVRSVFGISGIVRGSVASSELPACVCSIQLTLGNQIQRDEVRAIPVYHAGTPYPDSRTLRVCRWRTRQYLHIFSILTLMVFCVGLATLKYQEGLVVVGIQGDIISCLSSVDRVDCLTRGCRAETGRILDTYAQKGATRPVHFVQHQLGARNVTLWFSLARRRRLTSGRFTLTASFISANYAAGFFYSIRCYPKGFG